MKDFIDAIDIDMWNIVESGYELPKISINGIVQPKVKPLWTKKKGRNIS